MTIDKVQIRRDSFVDCFKGGMILWIIHIHTVFWSGKAYLPDIVRQVTLLADVPIFFFISGYVIRPSSFLTCLLKTVKQYIRLYLHYILICCLLLGVVFVVTMLLPGPKQANIYPEFISFFRLRPRGDLWHYLRVYGPSLWFIRVYFSLLLFIPFLVGISALYKIKYNVLFFILLFIVLFPNGAGHSLLFTSYGYCFFYLFFYVLGMILRDWEDYIDYGSIFLSLMFVICLGLVIFYHDNSTLCLQKYKFPPSIQYLIYSLPLVHIFLVLKKISIEKHFTYDGKCSLFLRWCGINSYYIYLFQGAVCSLPFLFIRPLTASVNPAVLYCLVVIFNLALTLLVSYVYIIVKNFIVSLATKVLPGLVIVDR